MTDNDSVEDEFDIEAGDLFPDAQDEEPEGRGSVTLQTRGLYGEYRHGLEGVPPVTKRPRNYSKADAANILEQPRAARCVVEVTE